jgi:hypothetical protein
MKMYIWYALAAALNTAVGIYALSDGNVTATLSLAAAVWILICTFGLDKD